MLGDEGATKLAEGVAANKGLTRLDVFDNGISQEGTLALGEALRFRPLPERGFRLLGVDLRECWAQLDLPEAASWWENGDVMALLRARKGLVAGVGSVCHTCPVCQ